MSLEITAIAGGVSAQRFVVPERQCAVVGRSNDADISFPFDPSISRMHFEIVSTASGYKVRDLGSCNGTYVQGERIHDRLLADREVISAGRTAFVVRVLPVDSTIDIPPLEPADHSGGPTHDERANSAA